MLFALFTWPWRIKRFDRRQSSELMMVARDWNHHHLKQSLIGFLRPLWDALTNQWKLSFFFLLLIWNFFDFYRIMEKILRGFIIVVFVPKVVFFVQGKKESCSLKRVIIIGLWYRFPRDVGIKKNKHEKKLFNDNYWEGFPPEYAQILKRWLIII